MNIASDGGRDYHPDPCDIRRKMAILGKWKEISERNDLKRHAERRNPKHPFHTSSAALRPQIKGRCKKRYEHQQELERSGEKHLCDCLQRNNAAPNNAQLVKLRCG